MIIGEILWIFVWIMLLMVLIFSSSKSLVFFLIFFLVITWIGFNSLVLSWREIDRMSIDGDRVLIVRNGKEYEFFVNEVSCSESTVRNLFHVPGIAIRAQQGLSFFVPKSSKNFEIIRTLMQASFVDQ
jgi:hypothetical protein